MIVPSTRLIAVSAFLLTSAATVELAVPESTPLLIIGLLFFLFVTVVDAARNHGLLDDVFVEFPDVIRLAKDRAGEIPLFINHKGVKTRMLRMGISLPPEIQLKNQVFTTELPGDAEHVHVAWECTPRERGNFIVENVYAAVSSPLGLWSWRHVLPARGELRVYPNLHKERKHLAALFLNRGPFGIHAQRQVGKGREFEKLREYLPGDSFEDIHWKATARRAEPITKQYQIERTQEVYVLVDNSRLSARPAIGADGVERTTQLERCVTAALALALAAERQGDHFGMVTYGERVHNFVPAKIGGSHFSACRDALYALEPEMVNPSFEEVCTFIRLRLRKRALLIFLTSLDDPVLGENFVRNITILSRHHLVLVGALAPPGLTPLFSDPAIHSVEELYDELAGHIRWQELQELTKALRHRNVRLTTLDHGAMALQLITEYINIKRRQLL